VSVSDFEHFYADTRDAVFRAVVLATRRPDRAEEAVAEAFARALERWDVLAEHPNPVGWVVRTAMNHFISGWRMWRREGGVALDVVAVPEESRSLDPFLLRHLWRLPRRQREVVALRILLDLDTRQTADALGMAPGDRRRSPQPSPCQPAPWIARDRL
jgi:DNA-directed RNA polymerase specialized sigma24 family protein